MYTPCVVSVLLEQSEIIMPGHTMLCKRETTGLGATRQYRMRWCSSCAYIPSKADFHSSSLDGVAADERVN
jgi:hypothetical protein